MQRFKGFLTCLAAALSLVIGTGSASLAALVCQGDQVTVGVETHGDASTTTSGGWVFGDGSKDVNGLYYAGELLVTDITSGACFKTFCLQLNVDIQPYFDHYADDGVGLYTVETIGAEATGG